jgi:hypothetical protein
MRKTLLVIGVLALLLGLIWIGQGTGVFPYPKSSFMIDQLPWTYRGLGLAFCGLIAIVISHRLAR